MVKISERCSWFGFEVKKWITGNKKAVFAIVSAVVALAVSFPESAGLIAMAGGEAVVISYLVQLVNFWTSKVELNKN